MKRFLRGVAILWVVFRYGLDGLVLDSFQKPWLRALARLWGVAPDDAARREAYEKALAASIAERDSRTTLRHLPVAGVQAAIS